MQQDAKPQAPWNIDYFVGPPYSEDCLSLNVWSTGGSGKAVVLFIPGGGFNQGGGGVPIYNGAAMAKAGVIFVSMNYRLSAAGFLAHPELAAEQGGHSGNYALMDVIAALRWIKDNIAAFGGDPARVTVMGQSAGAQAINALLHSPLAAGLFRGAILDSGVRANAALPSNAEREKISAEWGASKGATTLAQLRALPADALVPVRGQSFRFSPSGDGYVVTDTTIDVPVLTGWNGGEGAVGNGRLLTTPVTRAQFEAQAGDAILAALYPSSDDARDAAHALGHDTVMVSGAKWAAERLKAVKSPVYYYDFGHVLPDPATAADWGSYHSSELPYIFGTWTRFTKGEQEARIATMMRTYWMNFIKTGNPNGAGLALWQAFDPAKNDVMSLGETPGMRPIASADKTALLSRP